MCEIRLPLKTTCFDAMINYHLSKNLKQLRNHEFNNITIILAALHKKKKLKKKKHKSL